MRKVHKPRKAKTATRIRVKYADKRHTDRWVNRKKRHLMDRRAEQLREIRQKRKPFVTYPAPKIFSLVKNTNEVLKYFEDVGEAFKNGDNVNLDISGVEELTSDALTLLVSSISDEKFCNKCHYKGNEPVKPELKELFASSGFYDHVAYVGSEKASKGNLMHREENHKVVPSVAKNASLVGIRHVLGNKRPFEPLYAILIECMSNTNNHADLKIQGKCKWWLDVYSYPKQKTTCYSFLDLGVGIFNSVTVQGYVEKVLRATALKKNISLVDDLLDGNIVSRIEKDKSLRGKGIPQIIEYANSKYFQSFYLITNDVKINLKTREREELEYNLKGTFLYWELWK